MKKLTKISMILAIASVLVSNLFAASQIKVICDKDGQEIYLNGKFKAECDSGEPVPMMVKAGKYTVEVKKDNGDGSYYYYKKSFRIGDGVQKIVEVSSNFTEILYGSIQEYKKYLEKFPNGKYAKRIKKILDESKKILDECNLKKRSFNVENKTSKINQKQALFNLIIPFLKERNLCTIEYIYKTIVLVERLIETKGERAENIIKLLKKQKPAFILKLIKGQKL